jgi:3,4-dihydroxy 2-butanone 4-phosphate synthase/GTP cyclohydrolase II
LMAKLQAYELQDAGIDTVQANHALGFKGDCRDFSLPAAILHDLGIKRVRLLTNNRRKAVALTDTGIEVIAQISCEVAPTPYSLAYLQTKKEKMEHALSLRGNKGDDSSHFGARGNVFPVGDENRASNAGWRVQGIEAQL